MGPLPSCPSSFWPHATIVPFLPSRHQAARIARGRSWRLVTPCLADRSRWERRLCRAARSAVPIGRRCCAPTDDGAVGLDDKGEAGARGDVADLRGWRRRLRGEEGVDISARAMTNIVSFMTVLLSPAATISMAVLTALQQLLFFAAEPRGGSLFYSVPTRRELLWCFSS